MTRCCKDSINLKSSVYNQTGQSYIDQVSLHRSMCIHLRRVLLAKSVVDSRNPRYTRAMQQRRCRPSSCKLRFPEGCPSDETIDKLAYDTEHHPFDLIKIQLRNKNASKERSCSADGRRAANDVNCPCSRPSTAKERSPTSALSNSKNTERPEDFDDCRTLQLRAKEIHYDDKRQFFNAKTSPALPCCVDKLRKCKAADLCRGNCGQRSSPEERKSCPGGARGEQQTFPKSAEREEEEARYAKFVYDITQEIVQNGLYTDRELKEVFEKHLERNSGRLSKRKMLYEIYQLKISLNMIDEDEEEDEQEADLVFAEKFTQHRVPKPPTPPKVLNENKVLEKLESFRQQDCAGELSPPLPVRRNVVLVDPNPEFLVTERDLLSTLMDNDVDPELIQRIYKNLCKKSKDMSLCEAVQIGGDITYTHRLKHIDRSTSATSLNSNYVKNKSHGILRKESTDFVDKLLSSETSYYKYLKCKRNEALEKCEKWNIGQCNCKIQPCREHGHPIEKDNAAQEKREKERRGSTVKSPNKNEIVEKTPAGKEAQFENKKISFGEKAKVTGVHMILNEVPHESRIMPEVSRLSDVTEEKKDEPTSPRIRSSTGRSEGADTYRSAVSGEENEEIEEEIESVPEDLPEKAPGAGREAEDEEEELEASTARSDSYSDDFSDASESSGKNAPTGSSSAKSKKLKNRRYSTMREYLERFSTVEEQRVWRISEGSSDSSSASSRPTGARDGSAVLRGARPAGELTSKGRASSTASGPNYKPLDAWKDQRVSQLSSDFYLHPGARYCEASCRGGPAARSCSERCRFVKTNCRNLSNPTDCLNRARRDSDSSELSLSS